MKKAFFYFSLIGFLMGLTVHVLSVAGIDVKDHVPYVWVLHIGIFIAWGAAMYELTKNWVMNLMVCMHRRTTGIITVSATASL